jgi:hypothetical protein
MSETTTTNQLGEAEAAANALAELREIVAQLDRVPASAGLARDIRAIIANHEREQRLAAGRGF